MNHEWSLHLSPHWPCKHWMMANLKSLLNSDNILSILNSLSCIMLVFSLHILITLLHPLLMSKQSFIMFDSLIFFRSGLAPWPWNVPGVSHHPTCACLGVCSVYWGVTFSFSWACRHRCCWAESDGVLLEPIRLSDGVCTVLRDSSLWQLYIWYEVPGCDGGMVILLMLTAVKMFLGAGLLLGLKLGCGELKFGGEVHLFRYLKTSSEGW